MDEKERGEKKTVLIVDDEAAFRRQLNWSLKDEFQIVEADSRASAIEAWKREDVDVVLCDLHMPPHEDDMTEGLSVIESARQETPPLPVIVLTGRSSQKSPLEAIRRGAFGYLDKEADSDDISPLIRQAARVRQIEREFHLFHLKQRHEKGFGVITSTNEKLQKVLAFARNIATTDVNVLITGESGTGKGLLAKTIHEESPRRNGRFVAISCSAIPESLIESELFGYERGAFTGAGQQKKGRIEWADGGTLFLDEISELSLNVQVKLLNVIQDRTFERLGGDKTLSVDMRLITATNKDLQQEVEAGRFRKDLYYRLKVVPLSLPPLRERIGDIPALAASFVEKFAKKHNRLAPRITAELLDALQDYDYPGNVRELENAIERLMVLSDNGKLNAAYLPEEMLKVSPEAKNNSEPTLEDMVNDYRKNKVLEAIEKENGNKSAAAKRLGISRSYLYKVLGEGES